MALDITVVVGALILWALLSPVNRWRPEMAEGRSIDARSGKALERIRENKKLDPIQSGRKRLLQNGEPGGAVFGKVLLVWLPRRKFSGLRGKGPCVRHNAPMFGMPSRRPADIY